MKKIKFRAFIPDFRKDYYFTVAPLPVVSVSFIRRAVVQEIIFVAGWLFWAVEITIEKRED
jgi:hypothetical protein